MVGEVATYLHAINPQEESAPDVLAEEDDDELGWNVPRTSTWRTPRRSRRMKRRTWWRAAAAHAPVRA